MQIAVTSFLDQLYELLARSSALVTLYQKKESTFIPSLISWLEDSESTLEKNKRPHMSEIAGVRAQLLSASHGVFDKFNFHLPPTGGPKKVYYASAGILFNKAQNILIRQHESFSALRIEAEKSMRQIVLISLQKNTFNPIWKSDLEISLKLIALWQSFTTDPDLVQGTRQILSNVNYVDALRILDEVTTALKL